MRPIAIFACLFVLVQCIPQKNGEPATGAAKGVDQDFKVQFDNCIQIVTMRQIESKNPKYVIDFWSTINAFQCLHAVTGVSSNIIADSNTPYFYPTTESKDHTEFFYEDLVQWHDWYEQNKFSMTMAKADSLVRVYEKEIGDTIQWPQSISLIFSSNPPKPIHSDESK
jgi:hypothetical protein